MQSARIERSVRGKYSTTTAYMRRLAFDERIVCSHEQLEGVRGAGGRVFVRMQEESQSPKCAIDLVPVVAHTIEH